MKLSDVVFATSTSAAFKMVAFSRSSRLTLPISLEMEMGKSSPSTSRMMAAARVSWLASTGENTLVMATLSHSPLHLVRNAAQLVLIEGGDFATVELVPAAHKEPLIVDSHAQLCWPIDIGLMARVAGQAPMQNHGNAIE